jgi:hypothetical protein
LDKFEGFVGPIPRPFCLSICLSDKWPFLGRASAIRSTWWPRSWNDAVCINQQDIPEKNSQVQLMREIYERARKVQIWLVTEDEDSKRAFGTIQRLAQVMDEYEAAAALGCPSANIFCTIKARLPTSGLHDCVPFTKLLARQWFLGVWTLREVIVCPLTRRIVLVCGNLRC